MGSFLSTQKDAKGLIVLITGCSDGGIGHALALEYASRGATVYATSRRKETMTGLASDQIEVLEMDVTSVESVKAAVDAIIDKSQRIDILVNNAAISPSGPAAETPLSEYRRVWETNVGGVVAVTQAVFPHMRRQKSGTIVNVSSLSAFVPTPLLAAYASSKAALNAITDCMRMEMKPFGVKVVLVAPGIILTPMPDKHLPASISNFFPDGPYLSWKALMEKDFETMSKRDGMTAEECARQIANASLKNEPSWLCCVNFVWWQRVFIAILPKLAVDALMLQPLKSVLPK